MVLLEQIFAELGIPSIFYTLSVLLTFAIGFIIGKKFELYQLSKQFITDIAEALQDNKITEPELKKLFKDLYDFFRLLRIVERKKR